MEYVIVFNQGGLVKFEHVNDAYKTEEVNFYRDFLRQVLVNNVICSSSSAVRNGFYTIWEHRQIDRQLLSFYQIAKQTVFAQAWTQTKADWKRLFDWMWKKKDGDSLILRNSTSSPSKTLIHTSNGATDQSISMKQLLQQSPERLRTKSGLTRASPPLLRTTFPLLEVNHANGLHQMLGWTDSFSGLTCVTIFMPLSFKSLEVNIKSTLALGLHEWIQQLDCASNYDLDFDNQQVSSLFQKWNAKVYEKMGFDLDSTKPQKNNVNHALGMFDTTDKLKEFQELGNGAFADSQHKSNLVKTEGGETFLPLLDVKESVLGVEADNEKGTLVFSNQRAANNKDRKMRTWEQTAKGMKQMKERKSRQNNLNKSKGKKNKQDLLAELAQCMCTSISLFLVYFFVCLFFLCIFELCPNYAHTKNFGVCIFFYVGVGVTAPLTVFEMRSGRDHANPYFYDFTCCCVDLFLFFVIRGQMRKRKYCVQRSTKTIWFKFAIQMCSNR